MKIIDLKGSEAFLDDILKSKSTALEKSTVGVENTWRYVLYSYDNREKFHVAMETLLNQLFLQELNRLNIQYIQGYLSAADKENYKMLHRDIEFCEINKAILEEALKSEISRSISEIVSSKKALLKYLKSQKIKYAVKNYSKRNGKNGSAIGFCQLHKIYLDYHYVRNKQCMEKEGHKMCSNYLILSGPFWHSPIGFSLLSSASISDRARYRKT